MKHHTKHILCGVGAAIIGVVLFFGGVSYGKRATPSAGYREFGSMMQGANGGIGAGTGRTGGVMRFGGGFTGGEVLAKDAESITVKIRDGGSKIIFFSSSTSVMKSTEGSIQDVAVGQQVTVSGKQNSDGSMSADSIQLRPAFPAAPQQ